MSYRGNATLGNGGCSDKLTNDRFLSDGIPLSFDRIDFGLGQGQPQVHVGAIALSDFYARIILNSNGRVTNERHHLESRAGAEIAHACRARRRW